MKLVLYLIHELIRCEAFSLSCQEIRLASMESTGLRSYSELFSVSEPHSSVFLHESRVLGLRQTQMSGYVKKKKKKNLKKEL